MATPEFLGELNSAFRSGVTSLALLKDSTYKTYFRSITFRPYHPYFEMFNEKIGELISGGILQHLYRKKLNPKSQFFVEENIGPQILTMEHLEMGFAICLIPLTKAIIAFIFELLLGFLKMRKSKSLNNQNVVQIIRVKPISIEQNNNYINVHPK